MEEHDYPQLASHRAEHVQFCEVIAETCYGASLGVIGAHELYDYLARWWKNHILYEDMKYKPFFAARELDQCD
jgi:hemerythrin